MTAPHELTAACSHCGSRFRVMTRAAVKAFDCPKCGTAVVVRADRPADAVGPRPSTPAVAGCLPRAFALAVVAVSVAVAAPAAAQSPRGSATRQRLQDAKPDDPDPVAEAKRRREVERLPADIRGRIDAAKPAVALVRAANAVGSGFLVAPGLLATNAHVIANTKPDAATAEFLSAGPADRRRGTRLLYLHRRQDLALLAVDTDLRPLPVADPAAVREGLPVAVIGNPGESDGIAGVNRVTVGRFLEMSAPVGGGRPFYRIDAYAEKGNSGGPVISQQTGAVIGMLTFRMGDKEDQRNFCVPADALAAAVATVGGRDGWAGREPAVAAAHTAAAVHEAVNHFGENAAACVQVWELMIQNNTARVQVNGVPADGPTVIKDYGKKMQRHIDAADRALNSVRIHPRLPEDFRKRLIAEVNTARQLADLVARLKLSNYRQTAGQVKRVREELDALTATVDRQLDALDGK